jgi:hypothetical protein
MLRYSIFGFSYLASLLIVLYMPQEISRDYLQVYSISSAIFGFFLVFSFSNEIILLNLRKYLPHFLFLAFILTIFANYKITWIMYPFFLLFSDYLTSQGHSKSLTTQYRAMMIISAVPFLLYPDIFNTLLKLRILICIFFSASSVYLTRNFKRLNINKIYLTLLISNLGYFGTLFCLTFFVDVVFLKLWYVGTQVALLLILKRFDYSIRNDILPSNTSDLITYLLIVLIFIYLMIYHLNYSAFIISSAGVFLLSRIKNI